MGRARLVIKLSSNDLRMCSDVLSRSVNSSTSSNQRGHQARAKVHPPARATVRLVNSLIRNDVRTYQAEVRVHVTAKATVRSCPAPRPRRRVRHRVAEVHFYIHAEQPE